MVNSKLLLYVMPQVERQFSENLEIFAKSFS